ncbi:MAG TPA: hypothetical protein VMQ17_12190 [Candidatus Sulfotelmatobacter sp.]|nr:hypothetical protein [Candidatus Sulfotelmatobacter sp.]
MANNHKRDQWLQDIEARQRNVVFPEHCAERSATHRGIHAGKASRQLRQTWPTMARMARSG